MVAILECTPQLGGFLLNSSLIACHSNLAFHHYYYKAAMLKILHRMENEDNTHHSPATITASELVYLKVMLLKVHWHSYHCKNENTKCFAIYTELNLMNF